MERVALRHTVLVTLDGTTTYVPNSYFLIKPMVNYSQRPKRQLEIYIQVEQKTPVEKMQMFMKEAERILTTLHSGLTSHTLNLVDIRTETITSKSFFVVLDELYTIRIYSFTEELDPKRHALIKSEVWLALGELMEELDIIQRTSEDSNRMSTSWIDDDTPLTLDIAGLRP